MTARPPVGILVSSGIILLASFLPWGSLPLDFGAALEGPASGLFQGMQMQVPNMTVELTPWNSHVSPFGVKLPTWLVVICGLGVGVIAALGAMNKWRAPSVLPIALSAYGLLHSGYLTVVMAKDGELGIGSIATVVAFSALLTLTIRAASETASPDETRVQE